MATMVPPPDWALERLRESINYYESIGVKIDHWEWRSDWSFVIYLFLG